MKDIVERLRFCEDVLSDLVKQCESPIDMANGLRDRVRKAQAEMYNISEEITAISEGFDLQFDSGTVTGCSNLGLANHRLKHPGEHNGI